MRYVGISRLVALMIVIVVIVAIASFFGGMYAGSSGAPQRIVTITATQPQRVTIVQTIIPTVTPSPQITTPTQTAPPIVVPDKIVIGLAIPLTGSKADEGKRGFWGIMAAVKWVNEVYGGVNLYGKKIPLEVRYYDDQSNKDLIPLLTERLITVDRVHFIIGTYSSPLVTAQAPITEKYGYVLVNWGAASDYIYQQGYKYVVGIFTPASKYLVMALEALRSIDPGLNKIAIMYKDDEFNRASGIGASAKAKEMGFQIVYEKVYPTDIKDFTPYITDLARSGAGALFVSAHYADGQLLTRQLADAGVNFKYIAINIAACLPSYYETLGKIAEGILCPSQWEPGAKYSPDLARSMGIEWFGPTSDEFLAIFRNVTGDPKILPSYHSGSGAAAVLALVKAIEIAQSLDQDAVRQAFNRLHIMTFYGVLKIDPATGNQVGHEMVLGQWQNGRFVIVWPQGAAEARLYYPLPTWDEKRAGKTASY